MENCSIRNFSPATGPISTPWSAQLRKSNSPSEGFFGAVGLTIVVESWMLRLFNAQHPTLNTQRSIQTAECWMLDHLLANPFGVGRWAFPSSRRVKGAWWPSRSSKPLSVRKSRGRFDSCPLRQSIFDFRLPIFDWPQIRAADQIKHQTSREEVNAHVSRTNP
jgi:hypothetical protein